ncbi:MAG: cell division protein FtsQ/DivIB [Planctomycetaceae bacterium]
MPPGVPLQPPRRRDAAPGEAAPGRVAAALDEHRAGLGSIVFVVAAVALGWAAWTRLGDRARATPDLVLHPDGIAVDGVAPWVRADVKGEALRDASLDGGVPLDDPELVRRLARAFAMHPWVREVVSVRMRHPAAADVTLRCREPVAMVAVPGGMLAIDAEGVVLPSDDFTAEAAAAYPRVTGVSSSPQGAVGFPWGDPAVDEAAAVAAAVGPDWKDLGLSGCRPAAVDGRRVWELTDGAERIVRFGSAPGREQPGEPTAAAKIVRLRSLPAGASGDLATASAATGRTTATP